MKNVPKIDGITFKNLGFLEYPHYAVGNDGSVWSRLGYVGLGRGRGSISAVVEWHSIKPVKRKKCGRLWITLCNDKTHQAYAIHRLVLMAFVGKPPKGMVCRHLNGVPQDNKLSNLKWGTLEENQADRITHGTDGRGEKHPLAKLTVKKVLEIRKRHKEGENYPQLGHAFGVDRTMIGKIVLKKNWRHI